MTGIYHNSHETERVVEVFYVVPFIDRSSAIAISIQCISEHRQIRETRGFFRVK